MIYDPNYEVGTVFYLLSHNDIIFLVKKLNFP